MVTRGVIRSSAVSSPKRRERSTRVAVCSSIAPRRAELRTSETSSWGERAEASSSVGSIPNRRTIQLAVPLSPLIAQRNTAEKTVIGPAVARATARGLAMARFLGISSPSTIDNDVAMMSASASDVPEATDSLTPSAVIGGLMIRASTGSAM